MMPLISPRCPIKGLILSDGTQLHVPRPMRETVAAGVKIGDRVSVRGDGVRSDLGTSLTIADISVDGQPLPVVRKDVKHYKQAAEHHEQAAHHHHKAAKYYKARGYEKAGHHAQTANEHHLQALHHVEVAAQQKAIETIGAA